MVQEYEHALGELACADTEKDSSNSRSRAFRNPSNYHPAETSPELALPLRVWDPVK